MQSEAPFPKTLAKGISILFHPVFVPALLFAVLIFLCPSIFFGIPKDKQWMLLLTMSYTSVLFPLLTVFLLWRLQFIDSMTMPTAKERLGPLIASMMFYFWVYWLFHKQFQAPMLIQTLLLGVFITTVFSFMASIFFKVSLHASAWGGISMFTLLLVWNQTEHSFLLFSTTANTCACVICSVGLGSIGKLSKSKVGVISPS